MGFFSSITLLACDVENASQPQKREVKEHSNHLNIGRVGSGFGQFAMLDKFAGEIIAGGNEEE